MAKSIPQHMPVSDRNNIMSPFFVSLGFIVALIYTVIAFNTGDAFWFVANTELSQPVRIIIHHEGEQLVYRPNDPEFVLLAPVVEEAISALNNNALVGIGLSDVTLNDYATQDTVLEVHYSQAIKFGTPFRTGSPTRLLFPISGRHSGIGLFFLGNNTEWFYGALRMADPLPLYGYEGRVYNPGVTPSEG